MYQKKFLLYDLVQMLKLNALEYCNNISVQIADSLRR